MNRRLRSMSVAALCFLFALRPSSFLRADGGTLRLSERRGTYRITVFTSPTPFRAGPVDVSVFLQEASTGEPVPGGQVTVRAAPRDRPDEAVTHPATAEAATNKLYRSAVFDLPEPGWWEVEVTAEGLREPVRVRFELEAADPLPRWQTLWPWIGWPVLAVVLYGVHQFLVRRKARAAPADFPLDRQRPTRFNT